MAELVRVHPLADLVPPPRTVDSAVIITTDFDRPLVQLFARNGKHDAIAKKLKISGKPGQASVSNELTALPLSPGQWMLVGAEGGRKEAFGQSITHKVGKLGYISEQSDSRVCFQISGPEARELMSRGCRLDLHPSVASSGYTAQTQMAQVGVLIHQVDDAPTYNLYVYSGFSRSFYHWLSHTAAQFG